MVAPERSTSCQKLETEKRGRMAAGADHDAGYDADAQGVHVEQRQWRDGHVVFIGRAGAQLQAGQVAHEVVADHASFEGPVVPEV